MNQGHVGINVTDLERSERFYGSIFGLTTMNASRDANRRFAFLGDGTNIVQTLWEQAKDGFDRERAGLHHLSFQVDSIDEVRRAQKKVLAEGAKLSYDDVVPHAEGRDSRGIFFEDPDGTRLEIFTTSGLSGLKAPSDGPTCGFF